MRNLVTAAATALVLTVGLAAPSFADEADYGARHRGQSGYGQVDQDDHGDRDGRDKGDGRYERRGGGDNADFERHERRFDQWERGWRNDFGPQYGRHKPLSYRQLVRRLEFQGYYGVRNLRKSQWGGAWRAFAYSGRGRPVMLQINPYTGRVLAARPLWS